MKANIQVTENIISHLEKKQYYVDILQHVF